MLSASNSPRSASPPHLTSLNPQFVSGQFDKQFNFANFSSLPPPFDDILPNKPSLPSPETLGRVINALGRRRDTSKIAEVYAYTPIVLSSLPIDAQRESWFYIEDTMMEALAHAGNLPAAQWHRSRIIEAGGAPSADAYGAVISCIRNTTDDASVALSFFEESQKLGAYLSFH